MRFRSGVAIDLGTVNTLVYVAGRGIVIEEPSAIAISRASGDVVAFAPAPMRSPARSRRTSR